MAKISKGEVWQDALGDWRWRARAGNGEIIAESGEGYTSRSHAIAMIEDISGIPATVVESE